MNPVVQLLIAALFGAIATGAGAWVTWGRRLVDREQIVEIAAAAAREHSAEANPCETRCPYIPDRSMVLSKLEAIQAADERQFSELAEMRSAIARIEAMLGKRARA